MKSAGSYGQYTTIIEIKTNKRRELGIDIE
jgi:hypothetical protein